MHFVPPLLCKMYMSICNWTYFKLDIAYLSHFLFWICRCMKPVLLEEYWLHTVFSCYSWWRKLLHIGTVCYGPEPTQNVQNKFTLHFTILLNSVPRYNRGHFTFSPVNVTSSHTYIQSNVETWNNEHFIEWKIYFSCQIHVQHCAALCNIVQHCAAF
jgi:hypothetical protein